MALEITSSGKVVDRDDIEEVFFRCSKGQVEFYRKLLAITDWFESVEVRADGTKYVMLKAVLEEYKGELDPAIMPFWQLEAMMKEKAKIEGGLNENGHD